MGTQKPKKIDAIVVFWPSVAVGAHIHEALIARIKALQRIHDAFVIVPKEIRPPDGSSWIWVRGVRGETEAGHFPSHSEYAKNVADYAFVREWETFLVVAIPRDMKRCVRLLGKQGLYAEGDNYVYLRY